MPFIEDGLLKLDDRDEAKIQVTMILPSINMDVALNTKDH